MINALEEIMRDLKDCGKSLEDISAINISVDDVKCKDVNSIGDLSVDYDNGYGTQNLWGVVLFSDNTWLSRSEHDGSEDWSYNRPPTIEEVIKGCF